MIEKKLAPSITIVFFTVFLFVAFLPVTQSIAETESAGEIVAGTKDNIKTSAKASVSEAKTSINDSADGVVEDVNSTISEATTSITDSAEGVVENVSSNVSDSVTSTVENTTNAINEKTNKFFKGLFGGKKKK